MFAFLATPLAKIGGIALLLFGILSFAGLWLHNHDNAVRAEMQASADKAIAAAQEVARAHERAALEAQARDDAVRAASSMELWKRTHAVGTTKACVNSPAVRALLDGLRANTNGTRAKN